MAKVWEYQSNENDRLAEQVARDKDIVMTKPEMAKYLLNTIQLNDGDKVLEPCKGTGSFYNNLPDNVLKDWCEINEGRDFFDYTEPVDIIVSNPPFVPRKLFWKFHQHSMDIARREIYWLINLASLNVFTPLRFQEMKDKGWYIQKFTIVSDKRWFGRYCFIKISKTPNDIFTWHKPSF